MLFCSSAEGGRIDTNRNRSKTDKVRLSDIITKRVGQFVIVVLKCTGGLQNEKDLHNLFPLHYVLDILTT